MPNKVFLQKQESNMPTNQEKLTIFENIVARVGMENALVEYAKTIARLNGFNSYQEMNPPMPATSPNLPPEQQPGAVSSPISPEMGQTTVPAESNLNAPQVPLQEQQ
jgi:hypothetical protein